jgi:tetratricopeptide (TPR) repeat protein
VRKATTLATLALALLALSFSAAPAQAANEAFAAGSEAFAEGDYLRALAYFEDARDAGVEGPAVHYNIGVCQYRLGNYAQAEAAFRLVADRYPKMRALAEYNLGLALLRQNRDAEARRQFEQVRRTSTDEKITRLAEGMLRRADASRPPSDRAPKWVSLIDFNVGHDDNVALLDDSSLPAGQSTDSAFTELLAVINGPLSTAPGFRFDGSVYAVDYSDVDGFDQTAARLGGAYQWRAGDWRMEAESHFNYTTLDGNAFEQRLGAGVRLRRPLSEATVIGISLVHDEVDAGESQFAFIEGAREQFGLSWDRYGASARLTLAYRYESNDRVSPSVSPSRNGVSIRYRYSMSPAWATDVSLSLRKSAFADLALPRDEDRTELSLGFHRRFSRGWRLNGTYRWSDNRSNVDAFAYTRSRMSLGLTKDF